MDGVNGAGGAGDTSGDRLHEEGVLATIREERSEDREGICRVHRAAFPTRGEADLVDVLRKEGAVCASFVAVAEQSVVGHALFSLAELRLPNGVLDIGALGPVAVLPKWQRRGIGGGVIRPGLERCFALGLPAVIVLGHPEYYGRFGFRRADTWGIRCEFDAPAEAFMIAWSASPTSQPALAKYHPAFAAV